jgi:integrase
MATTDTAGGEEPGEWPAAATSAAGSAMATPGTAGHEMLGRGGAAGAVARRVELTERAREFARGARADSTWAAYAGKWARFTDWCVEQEETPLPGDPLTVARFLTDLAPHWRPATPTDVTADIVAGHVLIRPGLRPSSIAGYLAAISVAHQAAAISTTDTPTSPIPSAVGEVANPARHDAVRRVLAGIRRHPTLAPARRRSALRPADMAAILEGLDPDEHLADARDAALLVIGWKAALRTDDLHRLDTTDIVTTDDGLLVHLRRSKTDQTGTGRTVAITTTDPDDPLDAVAAWMRWRNRLAAHVFRTGPAWRAIDRYGRRPRPTRLTPKSLDAIIARRAEAAGLVGDYGGHSLRRGFATSALAGGATERAVQRHGRWRSPTSMSPYVDEAERFDETNPTRFLGL